MGLRHESGAGQGWVHILPVSAPKLLSLTFFTKKWAHLKGPLPTACSLPSAMIMPLPPPPSTHFWSQLQGGARADGIMNLKD